MLVFYAFIFVHCIAFYYPATEALINNNTAFDLISEHALSEPPPFF